MARQTRPIHVAEGIWREGNWLYAQVRVGSHRSGQQGRRTQRFKLGTSIDEIEIWRLETELALKRERPAAAERGTLAADIDVYLSKLPEDRYKIDSRSLLQHWAVSELGTMPRAAIERLDIVSQISRWLDAGVAVNSCNKRFGRLRKLFHLLDGIDASNPTDKIKFLRETESEARDIPTRIVRLILDSLSDQGRAAKGETRPTFGKTKIRLRVMAWSGIDPATIKRVTRRDLDLERARVQLHPRRKGKGAKGAWVKLLPPAVDAFRDYIAAGLLGTSYSASSMAKTWRRGIAKATIAAARLKDETGDASWLTELENLPIMCRPYDLRHSFGSEMYERTGDIRAVSELMQHASMETTKRYTRGAVSARVAAAIDLASAHYAAIPTLPAPAAAAEPAPAATPEPAAAKRSHLRLVKTG